MSRADRKERIKELREAGAAAFAAGHYVQTCPEKYMDKYQWEIGWYDAEWLAADCEHVWSDSPDVSDRHCVRCFTSDASAEQK